MAERLFRGQIQPQARPLGAFVQPSRNNVPGAPEQPRLPGVSQIATLQQAGTSGVAGYNQMQQLADALGPLSKNLQRTVDRGLRQYAIGGIESGYYDELKNEAVRAKLRLQETKEAGTEDAARTVTALSKIDPVAGELAREANPWRAVGRNRALSQLAAAQLPTVFEQDMAMNAGSYAAMPPGSAALMEQKQKLTQQVFDRFGLSGDESEVAYYVTPVLNKTWDKFTERQSKLYSAELSYGQVSSANAAVSEQFTLFRVDGGITLQDGTKLLPEMPGYAAAGARILTNKIDKELALLGGKDRVDALEKIKETLGYWAASGAAGAQDVVANVRLGARFDEKGNPIKYEDRPRFIDAYPLALTNNTAAALESRNNFNQKRQTTLKDLATDAWYDPETGPGMVSPGSAEYQQRFAAWNSRWTDAGLQNAPGVGNDLAKDQQTASNSVTGMRPEQLAEELSYFDTLKPSDLAGDGLTKLREKATKLALQLANGDTKAFAEQQKTLYGKIAAAEKKFGSPAANLALQGSLNRFVKEDLSDPDIAALAKPGRGANAFKIETGPDGSFLFTEGSSPQAQKYVRFANLSRELYQEKFGDLSAAWWEKNEDATSMPLDVAQDLLIKAKNQVRESQAWKELKAEALGKVETTGGNDGNPGGKPNAAGSGVGGQQQPPMLYGRQSSKSMPANTAQQYTAKPVMNFDWIGQELNGYDANGYFSAEMNSMADKAGTSSMVFIRRQMDFIQIEDNPELQRTVDAWKAYLDQQINMKKTSTLPAQANFQYAIDPSSATYDPRAPGAWLMTELFPSAA